MTPAARRRPASAPLLGALQGLIARTYGHETAGLDAARFVIGDRGLSALYADRLVVGRVPTPGAGPMVLVRTGPDGSPRASIYYPDRLVANLERHDPSRGLGPENLRDFAGFVEELDHFLLLAAAWARGRPVRAVELELHANVTKVLVCALFVARAQGRAGLDPSQRAALRHELLERGDFDAEEPSLAVRYRDARRAALRFLRRLEATPGERRPDLLRRFSRAPLPDKLQLCA
jgi:hypothetical protein